jgi:hypothetical protein
MKVDVNALRYLTAVEMGMRNVIPPPPKKNPASQSLILLHIMVAKDSPVSAPDVSLFVSTDRSTRLSLRSLLTESLD